MVARYAGHCYNAYRDCAAKGSQLQEAVTRFLAAPDAASLGAARERFRLAARTERDALVAFLASI